MSDRRAQPKVLDDLPLEIIQLIVRHVGAARDFGAFALAAPHLLADPITLEMARRVGFDRASDVLTCGAPLVAVRAFFAHWDEPAAMHMVGDAAQGGRLDVVRWIYACVVGNGDPSSDALPDETAQPESSEQRRQQLLLREPLPTRGSQSSDSSACSDGERRCRRSSTPLDRKDDSDSDSSDERFNRHNRRRPAEDSFHCRRRPSFSSCSSSDSSSECCDDKRVTRARATGAGARYSPDNIVFEDVLVRAARHRHLDIVRWALSAFVKGPPPYGRRRFLLHTVMIEGAARGHVDVIKTLHKAFAWCGSRECRCTPEIGAAALRADRPDVIEWLVDEGCSGAPQFKPSDIAAAIAGRRRPRFIRWAASRGYRADPACLVDLANRNDARTLTLVHDTGLCVCTPDAVRAAARAGSLDVLKWAAGADGEQLASSGVGDAWHPTMVAMLAATHRHVHIISWLRSRGDGQRALTVGVARAALAAGCIEAAAIVRPFGTWDALEAAVTSRDLATVRAVADAGGVPSPSAFVAAIRDADADVLAFLCERYGVTFVEGALLTLAGRPCSVSCLNWLAASPLTAHICLAEAYAATMALGEKGGLDSCRCAACVGARP